MTYFLQNLWVHMINLVFSALAIIHLTYLGSVFNSSVDIMEEEEVSFQHIGTKKERVVKTAMALTVYIL